MAYIRFILVALFISSAYATPREIIIIRHGDKFFKKHSGQFLSAKGQIRAEKFLQYYLSHYEQPDYIIAAKPGNDNHPDESASYRPLQTVAPLASQLSLLTGHKVLVYTPYYEQKYTKLVDKLLHKDTFNKKLILICWQHEDINKMAALLGVTTPIVKWKGVEYDTVYVLKYTNEKLTSFEILRNQYPVNENPSWAQLLDETR